MKQFIILIAVAIALAFAVSPKVTMTQHPFTVLADCGSQGC
jgi:hypothetical protein